MRPLRRRVKSEVDELTAGALMLVRSRSDRNQDRPVRDRDVVTQPPRREHLVGDQLERFRIVAAYHAGGTGLPLPGTNTVTPGAEPFFSKTCVSASVIPLRRLLA